MDKRKTKEVTLSLIKEHLFDMIITPKVLKNCNILFGWRVGEGMEIKYFFFPNCVLLTKLCQN